MAISDGVTALDLSGQLYSLKNELRQHFMAKMNMEAWNARRTDLLAQIEEVEALLEGNHEIVKPERVEFGQNCKYYHGDHVLVASRDFEERFKVRITHMRISKTDEISPNVLAWTKLFDIEISRSGAVLPGDVWFGTAKGQERQSCMTEEWVKQIRATVSAANAPTPGLVHKVAVTRKPSKAQKNVLQMMANGSGWQLERIEYPDRKAAVTVLGTPSRVNMATFRVLLASGWIAESGSTPNSKWYAITEAGRKAVQR